MMGVSEERFWDSSPKELEPYVKAYKRKVEEEDYSQWRFGVYMMSAVSTAVDRCLNGKNSKSEYLDEPLLEIAKRNNDENMSQKQIEQERKNLFSALMIAKANSELNS